MIPSQVQVSLHGGLTKPSFGQLLTPKPQISRCFQVPAQIPCESRQSGEQAEWSLQEPQEDSECCSAGLGSTCQTSPRSPSMETVTDLNP